MARKPRNTKDAAEEIKIPMEYVEEIDRIIGSRMSIYPSRDEFIKSAVQIHVNFVNGMNQQVRRDSGPK